MAPIAWPHAIAQRIASVSSAASARRSPTGGEKEDETEQARKPSHGEQF